MNERIRELAEQANKQIRYRICPNTFKHIDDTNGSHIRIEFDKEKFAELIIKKCISQIALIGVSNFQNEDISWTVDTAIAKIEEHFGGVK